MLSVNLGMDLLGEVCDSQLRELDIVVPVVRRQPETTTLRSDIKEYEHALLRTDVLGDGIFPVGMLDEPVRQVDEGKLVHLAEVLKVCGDAVEQAACPISASVARDRHIQLFVSSQLGGGWMLPWGWPGDAE